MKYYIEADVIGTADQEEMDRKTGKKQLVKRAFLRVTTEKVVAGQLTVEVQTISAKTLVELDPGMQFMEIQTIPVVTPEGRGKLYFKIIARYEG